MFLIHFFSKTYHSEVQRCQAGAAAAGWQAAAAAAGAAVGGSPAAVGDRPAAGEGGRERTRGPTLVATAEARRVRPLWKFG